MKMLVSGRIQVEVVEMFLAMGRGETLLAMSLWFYCHSRFVITQHRDNNTNENLSIQFFTEIFLS